MRKRVAAGFTLIEVLIAVFLLTMVIAAGISLAGTSARQFAGTTQSAFAESDVTIAARLVERELRGARQFTVAADGQSITYWNNDDNYPPELDPTAHRFYRNGSTLLWTERTRPVLTNVPSNDTDGTPLRLFSDTGGDCVTAQLVSRRSYAAGEANLRAAAQRTLLHILVRNLPPMN